MGQNLPGSIGRDQGGLSSVVLEMRLQQEGRFGIHAGVVPIALPMADGGKYIRARTHQRGDVIAVVLPVMIWVRARRSPAQQLSVEPEDVIVVSGDVDLGQAGLVRRGKDLSEIREVV